MPRRTTQEQIEEVTRKLEIQKARLKQLNARNRKELATKERKERTHRLIQIGAICEEVYGDKITEGAAQDALRQFLRDQNERGGYFSKAIDKAKEAPTSGATAADVGENFMMSFKNDD